VQNFFRGIELADRSLLPVPQQKKEHATQETNEVTVLDRTFVQDPWAIYQRLRATGPVQRVLVPGGVPMWLVTSYADARALLADPRLSKDYEGIRELFPPGRAGTYESPMAAHMLNSDPPAHTRLRTLVNQALGARTIGRLRPRIEGIADELLDAMPATSAGPGGPAVDLIEAYAFRLPITVICELLGVPAADRNDFQAWSKAFVSAVPPHVVRDAERSVTAYLTALIDAKRVSPSDDLLSDLLHISGQPGQLWPDELVRMAFLLLVAGFEPTASLIGNGVLALLRHPGQLSLLRSEPSRLPGAIEELLRYEAPLHVATMRYTTEPVVVAGTEIPDGALVLISMLAANRDAERFADPDELDIARQDPGHLAFGHGIHYCAGAPLARLEGQIAIGRLLDRFPAMTLAGEAEELRWRGSVLMRSLSSLPVRLA
jgi:cytochrome P450